MEAFAIVTMAIYLGFINPAAFPLQFCHFYVTFLLHCYADVDLSSRQTIFMEAFAVVTMAIYLGFIHLLAMLLLGSFFSRTCLLLLLGE
jgi:hypothetical protein